MLVAALALFAMFSSCRQTPVGRAVATAVYWGGPIYTMDKDRPTAEAIAIAGDRILYVGSRAGARKTMGPETRIVELDGRAVFPGFNDAHAHLVGLGRSLRQLDLVGTTSFEQICEMVAAKVAETPPGQWILGRGWDQNDWSVTRFPSHEALSAVSPDNPVLLTRIDGHASLANARAMSLAAVDASTDDPDGGKIRRDTAGRPTGVFIDTAMRLVSRQVPETDPDELREAIVSAVAECHRLGLVGIHDAGVDRATLAAYRELIEAGRFDFRMYAMVSSTSPYLEEALVRGPEVGIGNHRLTVRSVKVYADGALGSRGAALLAPYSDDAGNRGLLITDRERISDLTRQCLAAGLQVCTHAIGDRGNREVLDAYEEALQSARYFEPRLRIEHAQILAPEDIPRFAELGVLPSMQPTHCTSDMDWVPDRLGDERTTGAYAWRSLLDNGNRIPVGSDFPVERVNPLLGVFAAVTRTHADGTPAGGWHPEQLMTRAEVVRGFTADAAYAAFDEDIRGTLTPGKLADLTIFDRDILECPADQILDAGVAMTVVGGVEVYRAEP